MKTYPSCLFAAVVLACLPRAGADVRPNPLFTDNAVLQAGAPVPVWGAADDGEKVSVEFDGQTVSTVAKDGKWQVTLKPLKAGEAPSTLTIKGNNTIVVKNVLVGEVWLCSGQSNMGWTLGASSTAKTEIPLANYPKIRLFQVEKATAAVPQTEVKAQWVECTPVTAKGFSGVAYFFGRDLHKATGQPVGLIQSSWGGTPVQTWMSLEAFDKNPDFASDSAKARANAERAKTAELTYPQDKKNYEAALAAWQANGGKAFEDANKSWDARNKKALAEGKPALPKPTFDQPKPTPPGLPGGAAGTPTVLYNAMIAPLVPYALKGAIWYQGEANSGGGRAYRSQFPAMIADWRAKWGQGDFTFLFVQIAPHKQMSPDIREAQFFTWAKVPNTAMTVITDWGVAEDIHPKNKEPVGGRLALAARALTYGEKIEYSGPVYKGVKFDGARAIVSFSHVGGGLVAKGGALKGFAVAGDDKKFVEATAVIEGDRVIVTNDTVTAPVAVRYGWANVPDVNLFNVEGIPATPFRSDADFEFTK